MPRRTSLDTCDMLSYLPLTNLTGVPPPVIVLFYKLTLIPNPLLGEGEKLSLNYFVGELLPSVSSLSSSYLLILFPFCSLCGLEGRPWPLPANDLSKKLVAFNVEFYGGSLNAGATSVSVMLFVEAMLPFAAPIWLPVLECMRWTLFYL